LHLDNLLIPIDSASISNFAIPPSIASILKEEFQHQCSGQSSTVALSHTYHFLHFILIKNILLSSFIFLQKNCYYIRVK